MAKIITGQERLEQYTASVGQTIFSYSYKIYTNEEITVYKNSLLLVLTTDYTVQGAGVEEGGTITLTVGAAENDILTLVGDSFVERETEFTEGGRFAANEINAEYDRIDNLVKELVSVSKQIVQLAVPITGVTPTIPGPGAGKSIKWNGAGTAFELTTYDPDTQAAAAAVSAAAAAADAAQAALDAIASAASAAAAAASAASINLPSLESHIYPHVTEFYNLGAPSYKWNNIRGKNIYGGDTGSVNFLGSINLGGAITTDVKASTDGTRKLGLKDKKWSQTHSVLSVSKHPVLRCEATTGGGGSSGGGTWDLRLIETIVENTVLGTPAASLSTNQIALPLGLYEIETQIATFGNATGSPVPLVRCAFGRYVSGTSFTTPTLYNIGPDGVNEGMACFGGQHIISGTFQVTDTAHRWAIYCRTNIGVANAYGNPATAGLYLKIILKQLRED